MSRCAACRILVGTVATLLALACREQAIPRETDVDVPAIGSAPRADAPPVAGDAVRTPGLDEAGLLTLDSLGILVSYGLDESGGPDAVLQRPLDAAFSGEQVLVLDASAPWVRKFELGGRFDTAMVRRGEGPGEATQPYTLAAADDGFLMSHSRGVERFSSTGKLMTTVRDASPRGAAAVQCDGALLMTSEQSVEAPFIISRALTRIGRDGAVSDTIAVHHSARVSTRLMWTWFADVRDGTLLFYTEEEDRSRLERRSCEGELLGELELDSVGTGLVGRATETGFVISTARSPHPSGVARVADRTLWATRRITPDNDSITMIEAFDPAGGKRRLAIDGWYQIFDADDEGRLLLGNSWTLGFNWLYGDATGDIPAVFLVDGHALIAAIDAHGAP